MKHAWLDLTLEGLAPHRQLQLAHLAKWTAASLLLIVTILTLIPDPIGDDLGPFHIDDKTGHVLAYVSLMSTWAYAVATPLARLRVMAALFVYGALLEGMQFLLGFGRQASWADMVANTLGLIIGLGLAVAAARLFRQIRNRSVEKKQTNA